MKRRFFSTPAIALGLALSFSPGAHSAWAESATPTVTGFTPGSGPVGTRVYVMGTNFSGTTTEIRFNGTLAVTDAANTANTVVAGNVPTGATTGPISIKTTIGSASSTANFIVTDTKGPSITSFSPESGPVGTSVVVHGTNFTGGSTVKFNGVASTAVTLTPSGLELTAVVPSGATTGPITVTNPAGAFTTSNSFTVLSPPTITSFSRSSGPVGCTVFIGGTNLGTGTTFKFNGVVATVVGFTTNATGGYVKVPVGATTGKVTATNAGGTATSPEVFTVTASPTITGFTPHSGPIGTALTIVGTNFVSGASVSLRGSLGATTVNADGTQLATTVPAGSTTGPVIVNVNGVTLTTTDSFTVTTTTVPPAIFGFGPSVGAGGTTVEIAGVGFTGVSAVRFGGVVTTAFTVNADGTRITATAPTTGVSGHIAVTTPNGSSESNGYFLYGPVCNGFSPASGGTGTVVTLSVLNLSDPTLLLLNGQPVPFTVKATNTISFVVPANGTTGKISITTSTGNATTVNTFTKTP